MCDRLTGLASFFPWNFIIAVFFAVVFAVIGITTFRTSLRKKEEESSPEPHPFVEKWKTAVAQFGFFPASSFSQSFVHALNIMSDFVGGRNFRYQLPWLVMIGTKEAGKSTILQSLDLDRPIGRPQFNAVGGDNPLCDWWFYDQGIVLDLDGKLVLNKIQTTSDAENWQQFLNLLTHHRPKRPLDGIVLTIPASEFIGQTALSHDDIMTRAEYLYGKLWTLQRVTGLRIPVYFVVTKCDLIPGFESFCKSIPTHNRHDIFGWSNDEPIDAIYNPEWVNIAFASINQSLYRAQEEIFATDKTLDERHGVFMFPLSFNTLKGGIRTYTNHIFKKSSFHESFFLRGIYFVGDSHLNRPLPLNLSFSAKPTLTVDKEGDPKKRNIYFTNNIFGHKVFREVGLARPVSRVLLRNTRAMRIAKVAVALVGVIGTLGLLRANEKLQDARLNLEPALKQVEMTLTALQGQKEGSEVSRARFDAQAKVLLNIMSQINVNHLSSIFIPASWFNTIDKKIRYVTLEAYKSSLFNEDLLFKEENGLAVSSPSLGAMNLQTNLESFFNEPFMAPTTDKMIATDVPIGSTLFWDSIRLQDATHLVKVYNDFMNERFLQLPKRLQPVLQSVAREGLTKNLISLIADAQIFNSNIITGGRLAPEDAILSQVQNYRAVAPFLENLLFALRTNTANTAFSALRSILTTQTYGLLEKVNQILADEAPYAIKHDSFDWWNGKNMAALEAFGVLNLNELKHHRELQRTRINYLTREFANPLVNFLEKINQEGMPGNLPLLAKWGGIFAELIDYDRKTPGNGLVELEDFIMNPLNEVTMETCAKYSSMHNLLSPTEGYFLSILLHIQERLHERCVALSGAFSMGNFYKLSEFFNANLAGKFPFVADACSNSPDANPEDIRTFFEMLDAQAGLVAALKAAKNLGSSGKAAVTFIEQMEQVRHFFGGYLAPHSTLPSPAFSFDVSFRVNREREYSANGILDWEFIAQGTPITMRSPSHSGFWEAGNPIQVVFRWALNSPLKPMIIESLPNFGVRGDNAVFSYDGEWALLRLLKQHQAPLSDLPSLNNIEPTTLRFDIPLTNIVSNSQNTCGNELLRAIVFIRVTIAPLITVHPKIPTPPVKGEASVFTQEKVKMGVPTKFPHFPSHAPCLNKLDMRL